MGDLALLGGTAAFVHPALPTGPAVSLDDIERICEDIRIAMTVGWSGNFTSLLSRNRAL